MDNDTIVAVTPEDRALAIVKAYYPEMPASYRGRRYQVALAAITEAIDEARDGGDPSDALDGDV